MHPRLFIACLLAALLVPASAVADELSLTESGKILRLGSGPASQLFPGTSDGSNVLVLDVVDQDGSVERHLVPGTESNRPEGSPRMVYEPSSATAYLLWEGMIGGIHPVLFLTSFDGTGFSDLIEITSGLFSRKGSPDLVVTRDTWTDETGREVARSVLHLTWWNEAPAGNRKLYAQVILEDGVFLGWTPLVDLSSLAPDLPASPAASASMVDLVEAGPGNDGDTVIIGFLDPESQRLVSLRAEVHPRQLSDLGEKARAHIIGIGRNAKSRLELAESLAAAVVDSSGDFHPSVVEYLAAEVAQHVLDLPVPFAEEHLPEFGDAARAHIIGIGARIRSSGLADSGSSRFLGIGATAQDPVIRHLIETSVVASWPAPTMVGEGAVLYLAASGEEALVAWQKAGRIAYRETRDGVWGEVASIPLGESLDEAAAHEILAARIRAR